MKVALRPCGHASFILLPAILCTLVCAIVAAQEKPARVRGLLKEAQRFLERNESANAKRIYEEILDDSARCIEARRGLGEVYFGENEWSKAADQFDEVLEQEPQNLRAHYCEAVAYRELGSQAALVMRSLRWSKAQEHFDAVLQRDSSFEDVVFQQATLQSYRGSTAAAIATARKQLQLKPTLLSAQLGLMKFYGDYIRETPVEELLPWLEGQQTEFAVYFTGELYRRKKRDLQAEQIFIQLLNRAEEVPAQASLLSLTRLYARQNDAEGVNRSYWRAVNDATSRLGVVLLFNDIKYILADEELAQYDSLNSLKEKAAFFRNFWTKRNPTPGANLNSRLLEHYQRLVFAEANYEYRGKRSHFNNPDQFGELRFPKAYALNEEFNDKGLIYLRFGEPDFSEITSGSGPAMAGGTQGASTSGAFAEVQPNEVWVYEATRTANQMIFHFVRHKSAGGNWRLAPMPTDPRALQFLAAWDTKYFSYLNRGEAAGAGIRDDIVQENTQTVIEALSSDRESVKKDSYFFVPPLAVEAFRGDNGRTSLDVSFGIPLTILAQRLADETGTSHWIVSVTLKKTNGTTVQADLDTLSIPVSRESRGTTVHLFRTTVKPDSYLVALYLEAKDVKMVGEQTVKVNARNYHRSVFQMSDVQFLLESSLKPKMEVEGVKVVPSPFRRVPLDKPFRLYHHLYHLRRNDTRTTRWTMEYMLTPLQLNNKTAKQAPISFSFEKSGTDEFADQYFAFNAANAQPGIYRLVVRTTDRVSESSAERSVLVELY